MRRRDQLLRGRLAGFLPGPCGPRHIERAERAAADSVDRSRTARQVTVPLRVRRALRGHPCLLPVTVTPKLRGRVKLDNDWLQMSTREQRVTPLELFFDLVFVYAITQVTELMSHDPTWSGVGRGLLVLAALWWAWTGYAWLTNALEPEAGPVRAGMFGAMAAMLVVALAVPGAFGADAVLFGVAYLLVRLLNLVLDAIAAKRRPRPARGARALRADGHARPRAHPRGRVRRRPLAGRAVGHRARGPLRGRPDRPRGGVARLAGPLRRAPRARSSSSRSASRSSRSASGPPGRAHPRGHSAAVLGIVVIAALWWAYFDVLAVLAQRQLSETSGATRARLARDYYSYLHLPMIAGIVLFALGLKKTIEQSASRWRPSRRWPSAGALALLLRARRYARTPGLLIRRRTTERPGWIGPGRLAARDRHAGRHPRRSDAAGAGRARARRGAVLGAHRLGRPPLPRAPQRGPTSSALEPCSPRYGA